MTAVAPRLLHTDAPKRLVSVVVPFLDERDTLSTLVERITNVLRSEGEIFEIVLVDDGSKDVSGAEAAELARRYPPGRTERRHRNRAPQTGRWHRHRQLLVARCAGRDAADAAELSGHADADRPERGAPSAHRRLRRAVEYADKGFGPVVVEPPPADAVLEPRRAGDAHNEGAFSDGGAIGCRPGRDPAWSRGEVTVPVAEVQ